MSAVVVRLPTAAARKVKQPWTRARFAAREQLPQFPRDRYRHPGQREALATARLIKQIEPSAALVIATVLFRQLGEMAQFQAIGQCAIIAATSGKQSARQAVEWLNAHRTGRTIGDNASLEWAFKQLEQEEAE